jgi:hypothetical protein
MKKYVIGITALCLAGCSTAAPESTAAVSTAPAQAESVWSHDPDMDFDSASDLTPFKYMMVSASTTAFGNVTLYLETEKTGYPGEWDSTGYAGDAMIVEKNNNQGIYTHDGSELYPVSVNKVSTPYIAGIVTGVWKSSDTQSSIVYGFANTATSKAQIFSKDFKSVTEVSLDTFNYNLKTTDRDPYLAYKGDELGVAGMTYSSSGAMSGWAFEKYTPADVKANLIVPVINDQFTTTGYVILASDGSKIVDVSTDMKYRQGSYVNDCYVISDGTYATIVDAGSGGNIATQYQDAKYFEDGYAPVKKSGKWGYIDRTGKEVTDFIFDDACTVYNGYAWVYYHGKYGIINLTDALNDSEKQVNAYWCAPVTEDKIGTLTVKVTDLTIRKGGSKESTQTGVCMEGSVYPVFEKKTDENYTWYRVNESEWIASEGTWAVFEEAK